MMISAFLGTSLVYQISSNEQCAISEVGLTALLDLGMGFIIFINETDWFEQNGYMKSDDKIIHFFEYKKEDRKNCIDKLYEISQDKDSFAERFNESFNYKKLDCETKLGLIRFFVIIKIEDYKLELTIKLESKPKNEKCGIKITLNGENVNWDNFITTAFVGEMKSTFKYLIENMAKIPSQNENEIKENKSNISSDSIIHISNENKNKEEKDTLSNSDNNNLNQTINIEL